MTEVFGPGAIETIGLPIEHVLGEIKEAWSGHPLEHLAFHECLGNLSLQFWQFVDVRQRHHASELFQAFRYACGGSKLQLVFVQVIHHLRKVILVVWRQMNDLLIDLLRSRSGLDHLLCQDGRLAQDAFVDDGFEAVGTNVDFEDGGREEAKKRYDFSERDINKEQIPRQAG